MRGWEGKGRDMGRRKTVRGEWAREYTCSTLLWVCVEYLAVSKYDLGIKIKF